jgi:CMP-N,N'-diacetyllegionaminic acid synthase
MHEGKRILAIIPARGGSKGLPGKNIKKLLGKPLIAWSIGQAIRSKYIDKIIVSTDDVEIAKIAQECGAEVPFLRPTSLARDDSPTSDTIIHVIDRLNELGESYDYIALLEPTSPLRTLNDIDNAISTVIQNSRAVGLVSVGEVHMEHPLIIKKINDSGFVEPYIPNKLNIHQRQQADMAYFPYGVIYISRVSDIKISKTFYTKETIPYEIERWQNYEIDDELDFEIIEQIMRKKIEVING